MAGETPNQNQPEKKEQTKTKIVKLEWLNIYDDHQVAILSVPEDWNLNLLFKEYKAERDTSKAWDNIDSLYNNRWEFINWLKERGAKDGCDEILDLNKW